MAGGLRSKASEAPLPKGDWDQKRFGPTIPSTSIEAREKAGEFLMDALGVPSSLHRSNGGALRES